MSWINVGVAAAGAVKGGLDAKAANKKAKSHDKFRKQAIAMSPWSGMGDPGAAQVGNTDMMSGMLGGGMQGAMLAHTVNPGGWGGAAGGMTTAPAGATAGTNALGGSDMAAKLGQQGADFSASMPAAGAGGQASAGALGGAPQTPWAGMSPQGTKHMMAQQPMLQPPTLGSGMMGLKDQASMLNVYDPKNMFGGGI